MRIRHYHSPVLQAFILAIALMATATSPAAVADLSEPLRALHERVLEEGSVWTRSGEIPLYQPEFVGAFYQARTYRPAWTDSNLAQIVVDTLDRSHTQGLNPDDYHRTHLQNLHNHMREGPLTPFQLARYEYLLTDALLLYARHMLEGKADPHQLDPHWNYSRRNFKAAEVADSLNQALAQGTLQQALDNMQPELEFYRLMQVALEHFRQLEASAQFTPISSMPLLRPDAIDKVVPELQQRLLELGYLPFDLPAQPNYNTQLVNAIKQL